MLREIWIRLFICAFIFLYITSYRSDWSARWHAGADSLFAQFFVLKQPCTAFQPILTISTQTTSHGQDLQMTIFLSRASLHCPPRSKVNVWPSFISRHPSRSVELHHLSFKSLGSTLKSLKSFQLPNPTDSTDLWIYNPTYPQSPNTDLVFCVSLHLVSDFPNITSFYLWFIPYSNQFYHLFHSDTLHISIILCLIAKENWWFHSPYFRFITYPSQVCICVCVSATFFAARRTVGPIYCLCRTVST